uniref:Uncharacterized protein n=1 Tax=Acrobeloides nanus TaxID=290746 RepID=A0A914EP85_9BILA
MKVYFVILAVLILAVSLRANDEEQLRADDEAKSSLTSNVQRSGELGLRARRNPKPCPCPCPKPDPCPGPQCWGNYGDSCCC